MARLLILGTGSLATATCCALADLSHAGLRVTVAGRRHTAVTELVYLAGARAAVAGTGVTFTAAQAATDGEALCELIRAERPDLVLVCASMHSPWERERTPSAWTDLIAQAGFGLTLPFQADLAVRAATAVAAAGRSTRLVNACFPDAVNPLLNALHLPVLCGIGNAGLVASSLTHALGAVDPQRLQVLAHHVHLSRPRSADDEARAWLDGTPVPDVTQHLAAQRATGRERLNLVTGRTAARLAAALLYGADWDTSLPGPWGLPGGYPVRIRGGTLQLALPPGLTQEAAVAWNRQVGTAEGVDIADGTVRFTGRLSAALHALNEHEETTGPRSLDAPQAGDIADLADGFPIGELNAARTVVETLRARLRTRPAAHRAKAEQTDAGAHV
ncbi:MULTISPECIES: hypothetical protein [Streptomyces]|uniref:Potassium transporter TrkA n=2 Tax=Streptomyces TaxID=1883 RepID=A0ABV9IZ47_9ACTN